MSRGRRPTTGEAIKCPACGGSKVEVIDSRGVSGQESAIRRRRRCVGCGVKFTTVELMVESVRRGRSVASALLADARIGARVRAIVEEDRRLAKREGAGFDVPGASIRI